MRKLKLNPEHLAVESFSTALADGTRGTVRGALYAELVGEPKWTDVDWSECTAYTHCAHAACNSIHGSCIPSPAEP
jgi:hypothetical protein